MSLVLRLLTLGVLPAVWLTGAVALSRLLTARLPLWRVTVWCLAPAVSLPVWSLLMTVSARWGVFHAPTWGAIGWIACVPLVPLAWRGARLGRAQALGVSLVLGLASLAALVLYAGFPHDSFFVGRDQATYANQALHIAQSGELTLDWPVDIPDPAQREIIGRSSYTATGLYMSPDHLIVQFSPVLPVWLAVAFSAFGIVGLQSFNAVVAALCVSVFFGVASQLVSRRLALAATVLFALNPMQVWISRITLSEILTQYLVLSALALLLAARWRDRRAAWALGGLMLGASVLVRIDGFVLAPLAMAFLWVRSALDTAAERRWASARRGGVLCLIGALALGVPFYFWTSRPYMGAQAKNLLPIAVGAALMGVLWWRGWGAALLRSLAARRASWVAAAVLLAGVGLYAFFVRPRWEPFAVFGNPNGPNFGQRTFREDSFVNLGIYLTPVVAFAALGGFWVLLRRALSTRARDATLLLLSIIGGYSLLYLYNPSISSDHPWGMRRFVPVVIPGVVLLAAAWLESARRFLRRRWRLGVGWVSVAAALGYWGLSARSWLLLREFRGAYGLVSEIADAIPPQSLVLCDVSVRVFGHLALGRGMKAIRFSPRDATRFEAVRDVLERTQPPGEPYYILTDRLQKQGGERPIRAFEAKLEWLEETTSPPADRIRKATFKFYLFERRGPLAEPWRYLEGVGLTPLEGVREGGLWPVEGSGEGRTRWTGGEAWLDMPLANGWSPRTLALEIVGMGPSGTWLTVRANGAEVYNAKLEHAPVTLQMTLPKRLRKRLKLELVSDTFRPSDGGASDDQRELGVQLRSITLR